jgi:drug/metabolite transporter, DME family
VFRIFRNAGPTSRTQTPNTKLETQNTKHQTPNTTHETPNTKDRLCIVLAAVLWSVSGAFTRILRHETPLRLGPEPVDGSAIAFYRALCAGLVLVPAVRRADLSFRWLMVVMVGFFATMNLTFILSMVYGKSSNAILLQYTAPMWMYLASVWLLGEAADRRNSVAVGIGLVGLGVIVAGGWREAQLPAASLALCSGFAYAGVIVCLRALRQASSQWLTVLNHLGAALALVPYLCLVGWPRLTAAQLGVVALWGTVQMALPYWLMARGLRSVSPQEAGAITLLEPILNPIWAYLVAPARETPTPPTLIGGAFILGALAWRYWPRARLKTNRLS